MRRFLLPFLAALGLSVALPAQSITEFLVCRAHPYGIASGPDGALWFTEFQENKVGRMTLAGQVMEFPVGAGPVAILAGADGALGVIDAAAKKNGRFDTGGGTA